jgi:ATP-dependent DNA helicase RecG
MTNSNDILKLIESREGQNLEFKSSFNAEVIETLVAFANADGGKVVIGINGKHGLSNVTINAESGQNWVNEVKNKTQPLLTPDFEIVHMDTGKVVVLSVPEYPVKPIAMKGRCFKRIGNSNHLMTIQEAADMHLRTFNTSWDSYYTSQYAITDISLDKVNQIVKKVNQIRELPIEDDAITVLRKMELIRDDVPGNACFLLFAGIDIFQATVLAGRFSDPITIKDSTTIRCDLFSQVEKILEFIKKHINKKFIITGDPQRQEQWQYPLNALREIVVNMIVHRNYQDSGDSVIKIYDDRIEFFNPGRLLEPLTFEHLLSGDYSSMIRNKKIATMFKEAGIIEQYGSGIQRILVSFKQYGLDVPVFENLQHGFRVIISSKPEVSSDDLLQHEGGQTGGQERGQKRGQESGQKTERVLISKAQEAVLELITENIQISRKELSAALKISESTIQKHIGQLRSKKLLVRVGPDKGGHWEVIGNSEKGKI